MNVIEPILYQSKMKPFTTAIATPGSGISSINYGQLEKLIHNVARSAIKAGLAPGDVAAISISDAILHATIILGLMRIGVVTMSLLETTLPDHISTDAIIADAPQSFSRTEKRMCQRLGCKETARRSTISESIAETRMTIAGSC